MNARLTMAKRKKVKKDYAEAPTSDCLLLCDDVLISQGKNKHSLMGVIGGIGVAAFPAVLAGYVAYARFSNVYSGQEISLRFTSAASEEVLFEAIAEFPAQSDPLGVYTLVIPIQPFVVRESGRYLFGAYHDDVPVAASPIQVLGPATAEEQSELED